MAHFVLSDFLNLSLQQSAETSSPLLGLNMAPAESLMVKNPSRPVARASQGLSSEGRSAQKPKGSKGIKGMAADAEQGSSQAQPDAGACCNTHDAVLGILVGVRSRAGCLLECVSLPYLYA